MVMLEIVRFLVLLCLFAGCENQQENAPALNRLQPSVVIPEKPKHSCDRYSWEGDTIFHVAANNFLFVQLNGEEVSEKFPYGNRFVGCIANGLGESFAGVFISDSSGQNWRPCVCDSIESAFRYKILHPDLNFDGHPDILIEGDDGGVHGNCFSVAFLYHPQQQSFYRYPALDLPNLSIDKKHRQYRARHYSSQAGGNCKWLYAWKNDTVQLLGKTVFQGCLGNDGTYGTFTSTIYHNSEATSDSLFLKSGKAWSLFEKMLWKD